MVLARSQALDRHDDNVLVVPPEILVVGTMGRANCKLVCTFVKDGADEKVSPVKRFVIVKTVSS